MSLEPNTVEEIFAYPNTVNLPTDIRQDLERAFVAYRAADMLIQRAYDALGPFFEELGADAAEFTTADGIRVYPDGPPDDPLIELLSDAAQDDHAALLSVWTELGNLDDALGYDVGEHVEGEATAVVNFLCKISMTEFDS